MFWRKIPAASAVLSRPDAGLPAPPTWTGTTEGANSETKEKRSKKVKESKKEDKTSFTVVGMRPIEIGGVADTYRLAASRHPATAAFDGVLAPTAESEGLNNQPVEECIEEDPFIPTLDPVVAVRPAYSARKSIGNQALELAVSRDEHHLPKVVNGNPNGTRIHQEVISVSILEDKDPFEARTTEREALPPRRISTAYARPNIQPPSQSSARLIQTDNSKNTYHTPNAEPELLLSPSHRPNGPRRVSFQLEVDSDADFVTERFESTHLQASLSPPNLRRSMSYENRHETYTSMLDVDSLIPPVFKRQILPPPISAPTSSRSLSPAFLYTHRPDNNPHLHTPTSTGAEAYISPSPMRATAPPQQFPSSVRRIRKENGPRLTGIENLGNTCYLNATIQCLSATKPFAQYFLSTSYWI